MKWITRERPKIDRVACPWLIARFIDRDAEFLFVPADSVLTRAAALGAIAFDTDGAVLSHRGDRCTFDTMLDDYGLDIEALRDLAVIVRGADTGRLDLAAQAPGLLAMSLGLSRLCMDDDHRMLAHGFVMYDALYEWLRYGRSETHGWNPGKVTPGGEPVWDKLDWGDLRVDLAARDAFVRRRPVQLRPKEFSLLVALVARAGRVLTRGFLLQHVWAYQSGVTSRTVDWHVAALRRRLGPMGSEVVTVRGVGYRWGKDDAG